MTDGLVLEVVVPWVPPVRMSLNRKPPPRSWRRWNQDGKRAAILAIRDQVRGNGGVPETGDLAIAYEVRWPRGRQEWDSDNLKMCFKGIRDAFELEGVIANDRLIRRDQVEQSWGEGPGEIVVSLWRLEARA